MLDPAIHLTYHSHRLARFVVQREEKNRRVHRAAGLLIQGVEQLGEITGVACERFVRARRLEARLKLPLAPEQAQGHRFNDSSALVVQPSAPKSEWNSLPSLGRFLFQITAIAYRSSV